MIVKKMIGCLYGLTLFAAAFLAGCNGDNAALGPGGNGRYGIGTAPNTATPHMTPAITPIVTSTPAAFTTPQTTPIAMVNLGSAGNYAVLSYSGITNSGATTVCGNLGTYPSASVDGGIVMTCSGTRQVATGAANTAETDLGNAYTDTMGRTGGVLVTNADIGGQTFYPGLYQGTGNLTVASADVHLNAKGNPNAVFVFKVQGDLIVGPGRQVFSDNGAQAANVFWAVQGYAALDTTAQFVGNILAYTSISMSTASKLEGRALAMTQNVTFLDSQITFP